MYTDIKLVLLRTFYELGKFWRENSMRYSYVFKTTILTQTEYIITNYFSRISFLQIISCAHISIYARLVNDVVLLYCA